MLVAKVEIYPSLFGLERMKNDSLYGPPKEMLDQAEIKLKKKKGGKYDDVDDFVSDEEKEKLGFNSSKMRKYELQKMKYFYAIIHCNSKKTARKIYEEYNDFEFEMSNIRLNLSYVADELKFEQKVKEVASEIPAGYKFKAAG